MNKKNVAAGTAAFAVYLGSTEYLGMSEVSLPDIEFMTETISGAGIGGEFDETYLGHVKAMSMSLSFRQLEQEAIVLAAPEVHDIELRAASQSYDPLSGKVVMGNVKHVMRVIPKKTSAGKLASASSAGVSGEYSVRYWKYVKDGVVLLEIDPVNFICIINGKDYLAETRSALGK